ncbi:hypothetical protein FVW20_13985 [Desulfovibrio oxamicus]|uniref:ATP-dependent DNA ligase family profile domain-containing protein n=1 Tax=Nitratidesulfovibrio oxamicus TaxID=32016 RepID=A0ABS0J6M6_9BACT|nr:hypothetical protein [Nitratidesulfovibrio oxamicus]MBG3878087.1 hypothetical protein [Nitratidesulfovibrio oxamicus]
MQLGRMAQSALRPMIVGTDIEAFRQHCGGSLGGLFHCMRYPGPRLLWDGGTQEFVDEAGAAVAGLAALAGELAVLRDAVGAALAGSASAAVSVSMDGTLLRGQDGSAHYRICDLIHPEIPVWRQVNLLADLFCQLEQRVPHVRPVPHEHTPAMKTETRVARWLATWKRPGCGGVLLKRPELVYAPGQETPDACCVVMR